MDLKCSLSSACVLPQVSLHDIRDAVINIYRERKFLAATLRDTRTVVGRLELIIGVVVHLVFIFFYLLIFRVRHPSPMLLNSWTCITFCFLAARQLRILEPSKASLLIF